MALPDVKILLQNGTLGQVISSADGVCGFLLTGVTEGSIAVGTPFKLKSYDDAVSLGLTATNNPLLSKEIAEFYAAAGDGTLSYWMIVLKTVTVDQMADNTNAAGIRKLIEFAGGALRIVGLLGDPTGATITNGLDAAVYTAATKLQVTLMNYANNKQWPMRGVIGGTGYSGVVTALTNMRASTLNRISIMVGDTVSGTSSAVGLLLGSIAALPVQRKVSRIKNGALPITTAFVNATSVDQSTDAADISTKGFITFRTVSGRNGFYYTPDFTCTLPTDDYNLLCRGRVIDKAWILTYATYIAEVDEEIPVTETGEIDPGYGTHLESIIENQVNLTMTANREISRFRASVDLKQNVLSTSKVVIVAKPTPVGYNSNMDVLLGFENPAL